MNCPVCGVGLSLGEIQEHEGYSLVDRICSYCRIIWVVRYEVKRVVSVIQQTPVMVGINPSEFGFDYLCPNCKSGSYVSTNYGTQTGWRCFHCGKILPNENIIPRGEFHLGEYTSSVGSKRSRKNRGQRKAASGYQRAPRVSRPIPAGAVGLKDLAGRLKVEPKKLRSWLRKVSWRKGEEAGSSWLFSPEEAEEVAKNFGR